ncbi:hypothetical protein ACQKJC_08695 [Priestia koreensis]|uniref:hypothetical protein n=1 Tax=Priestia koreensis TaxID=284581 RepID=UPI003CFBED4A
MPRGKKIAPIDTIIMTFVGRPSEEAIRNFVKQIRRMDEIIQQAERERENSLNSDKDDNNNA